jgi:hypothetical protein
MVIERRVAVVATGGSDAAQNLLCQDLRGAPDMPNRCELRRGIVVVWEDLLPELSMQAKIRIALLATGQL